MKTLFLSLTTMLFILACQSGSGENFERNTMDSKEMAPAMEESQSMGGSQPDEVRIETLKIIRNGTMHMTVDHAMETRNQINAILERHKAYVGNEQLDNNDYQTSYTIQIRVPAANLDALVAELEKLEGTVTYKSIQARDVTEEYIDLEARLTNKKAYLEQYRQLLKSAKTIEDILKVREQIRQLEEEIESVTGRLKYLTNQVDLSTLDLTLKEKKDYVFRPDYKINFIERLKDSLSGGWYGFVNFSLSLFRLWPFLILIVAAFFFWRRMKRRKAANK
jgi:flagellar biosynthesis chaperone FliJ